MNQTPRAPSANLIDQEQLDWSHIRLTYAVPIYINQQNAEVIMDLFKQYAQMPADVLERVLFVVVDDASPDTIDIPNLPINMMVLRVNEDIPWNNPGARNLGVVAAKSDKVFLTDIDHFLDEKTFRKLIKMGNPGKNFWRLKRCYHDGRKRPPHANSFMFSRGYFLKHYGYDEEFCGSYASDDVHFVKWMKYHGARVVTIWGDYKMSSRDINQGKGKYTHSLDRDKSRNREKRAKKLYEMKNFGPEAGHSRTFLNFTWKTVYISQRKPSTQKKNRLWHLGWWGRSLWPWG